MTITLEPQPTKVKTYTNKIVAIGDIHGSYHKLVETVEPLKGSGVEIIFLGDYVDRSPDNLGDMRVLLYLKDLQENAENYGLHSVTLLRGNHEQYLLNLKTNYSDSKYELWLANGGDPMFFDNCDPLLPWIDTFPVKAIRGQYLFVHAGVKPNVPLHKQSLSSLLWIREEFLDCEDHGLPYIVVHGHSVLGFSDTYEQRKRINCDNGACFGGDLMAIHLDTDINHPEFEMVSRKSHH